MSLSPLEDLRARLAASGRDFEWLDDDATQAPLMRVRCIGPFAGTEVIWEAQIMTLAHAVATGRVAGGAGAVRQCIEIFPAQGPVRRVDVALAVPVIDLPVIRKTLIMLRQYKRLSEGCHEFGPVWTGSYPNHRR